MTTPHKKAKSGYVSNLNPSSWKSINRTTFSKWITDTFNKKDLMNLDGNTETCKLFDYQQFIKNYLQYSSPYRGVIVYHGLGTGKSRTSISIAEVLSSEMDIVLLLPASLEQNYVGEIQKCGNTLYSYSKHWEFVAQKDLTKYKDLPDNFYVPVKSLKANKGCWVGLDKSPNFDSLNELERSQIIAQVNETVRNRYEFIHYNGISMKNVEALSPTFFDNKVIIIDEVHNFISRVSNSVATSIAFRLYLMMLNAVNCKLVLLSGTPIINKPIELAYLANLTRGFLNVANLKYNSNEKLGNVVQFLDQHKNIDYYDIDESSGHMSFVFSPPGFEFKDKKDGMLTRSDDIFTPNELLLQLKEQLKKQFKVPFVGESIVKKYSLFPTKEEVFDGIFINYDKEAESPIKNPMMLSRRLQGITSYFESYDPELYPKTSDIELITIPMANPDIVKKYVMVRMEEIKKEQRAITNRKNARFENSFGNVYRAFSRALCNFCFPDEIPRIYPSDIGKLKELDQVDFYKADDENAIGIGGASLNAQQYEVHKVSIMSKLKAREDEFLVGENLKNCSPKYFEIIKKIKQTNGLALVYSQFREVEGLGVLQLALEANGFAQFKLKKHGKEWELGEVSPIDQDKPKYVVFDSSDREQTKALVDLFNSDWDNYKNISNEFPDLKEKNLHGALIKVIMITQSGAEGISLKNVRQVHIMEPYWNKIRIKQVIGRAVRAGSHMALPKAERQVDVFLYLMSLNLDSTDKKKLKDTDIANAKDMIKYDDGKTSDQYIWEIATKKALIIDSLLDIVKRNAIDCELHKGQHKIKCFKLPSNFGGIKQLIYKNEPVDQDEIDESLKKKMVVKEKKVIEDDDASFGFIRKLNDRLPYNRNTMKVYDPVLFSQGIYEVIGFIIAEDGKARVGFLKDKYFP